MIFISVLVVRYITFARNSLAVLVRPRAPHSNASRLAPSGNRFLSQQFSQQFRQPRDPTSFRLQLLLEQHAAVAKGDRQESALTADDKSHLLRQLADEIALSGRRKERVGGGGKGDHFALLPRTKANHPLPRPVERAGQVGDASPKRVDCIPRRSYVRGRADWPSETRKCTPTSYESARRH